MTTSGLNLTILGDVPFCPVSVYHELAALVRLRLIAAADLPAWNAAIGLRKRIMHEYMNIDIDIERVLELVRADQHNFVTEFLLAQLDILHADRAEYCGYPLKAG